jgi:hypothetical protein
MEETEDDVSTSLLEGDETVVPEEMKEDDTDGTSDDATIEENSSNDQDSSDTNNNTSLDRNITIYEIDAAAQAALDDIMSQEPSPEASNDDNDNSTISETMLIETVGLQSCSNGWSYCMHETCGKHVKAGDLLKLLPTDVTINGKPQEAIKLVCLMDDAEGCMVGFIPRILMDLPRVQRNISNFMEVEELYRDSTNSFKRHKG